MTRSRSRGFPWLLLVPLVVLAGCIAPVYGVTEASGAVEAAPVRTDTRSVASIAEYAPRWRPLFRGIDYDEVRKADPDPQAIFSVRIDLSEPTVQFFVTPAAQHAEGADASGGRASGSVPSETIGRKTSAFLKEFHCQLAINASPFAPVDDDEGNPRDILGLSASRGNAYSRPQKGHDNMLISKDNKVTFTATPDLKEVYNAVCGFAMLLENGENVVAASESVKVAEPSGSAQTSPARTEVRHPRTAAGVSQDGRYLLFLLIDGRQPDYSVGATLVETADWIKQIGAYTALNLDGGGSTTLAIDDGDGGVRILNRPIHNSIPGNERVDGNHVGVFAQPIAK